MKNKEMKLRKINVSADSEKVKARVTELWNGASAEAKRKIKKLADLNVYRIIKNSSVSGNISESAAVAISWGLGISPFYVSGAADDTGVFTIDLLGEFLKNQKHDNDFIESYAKHLLSLEDTTVESYKPAKLELTSSEINDLFDAISAAPVSEINIDVSDKPAELETQAAVDNLTEEEVVTLMRALLIRAKVKNSGVGELAAKIKTLLLLN
jgi:hypothetical protein